MTATQIPLTISEAAFQQTVIDTAVRFGYRVHHSRPAPVRSGKWVTPIQGHAGLPDLVLARRGVVLFAELKRTGQYPSAVQRTWLTELGQYGVVWWPASWNDGTILRILRDGPDNERTTTP